MLVTCLQDLTTYNKSAVAIAKKYFNISDIDDFYKKTDPKPLIFCHFAKGLSERVYNEVTDYPSMYNILIEVGAGHHTSTARFDHPHAAALPPVISTPAPCRAQQGIFSAHFELKKCSIGSAWCEQHSSLKGMRHQPFASTMQQAVCIGAITDSLAQQQQSC